MNERLANSVSSGPAGRRRVVQGRVAFGGIALALVVLLPGCGQKGALVLPTPIAPPAAQTPASAPAPALPAPNRTP